MKGKSWERQKKVVGVEKVGEWRWLEEKGSKTRGVGDG
jgi:hypothetical protein